MESDPFAGDARRLRAIHEWRRRVGDWRIFFTPEFPTRTVLVHAIRRRTSTTY
jgi:mRNA-degrading endonuclease RelE of RelBE toxin-antitoxin system